MRSRILTLLLVATLILPIGLAVHATPSTNAQAAGWHDTVYSSHISSLDENSDIRFMPAGITRMVIGANGGVSVGTPLAAPSRGLYIQGDILANQDLSVSGTLDTTSLTTDSLSVSNTLQSPEFCIGSNCISTWPTSTGINGAGTGNQVAIFSASDTLTSTSGLVYSGGNLGVGVSSPTSRLTVGGNFLTQGQAVVNQGLTVGQDTTVQGNLGVGTAATSDRALNVAGEAEFQGQVTQQADTYYSNPSTGPILKDSSGRCYRLAASTSGTLTVNLIQCPDQNDPLPPTNVRITTVDRGTLAGGAPEDMEVTIQWSAPADTTGLTGYEICDKFGSCWQVSSSTTQTTDTLVGTETQIILTYDVKSLSASGQSSSESTSYTTQYGVQMDSYDTSSFAYFYCEREGPASLGVCTDPRATTNNVAQYTSDEKIAGETTSMTRFCNVHGFGSGLFTATGALNEAVFGYIYGNYWIDTTDNPADGIQCSGTYTPPGDDEPVPIEGPSGPGSFT